MRFRKSVKVCPGVRLNFSKSGVSTSIGVKGASVTVGKKGVYANYGVPGTGIYDRKRIVKWEDGSSARKVSYNNEGGTLIKGEIGSKNSSSLDVDPEQLTVNYKEDGTFEFYLGGEKVEDKSLISQIKRSPDFKEHLKTMNENRIEEYKRIDEQYTKVGDKSCKIFGSAKEALIAFRPKLVEPEKYSKDISDDALMKEASEAVTTLKFWERDKLVAEKFEELRNQRLQEKAEFERGEEARVNKLNKDNELQYEKVCALVNKIASGDEEVLDKVISDWVSTLDFPFDFNVDYALIGGKLFVDLDLPEIEDMPNKKAVEMASGVVKIKDKTQKEVRKDYEDCVFGLAVFFASHLFNLAIGCDEIVLSAYTQRRDKNGRIKDAYIISVKFLRESFEKIDNFSAAKQQCMKFENACNQTSTGIFKEINPYPGDIEKNN